MNKLYLLSALVAVAYSQATACSYKTTATTSGDYAYTWAITDLAKSSACYNEYIYSFTVDTVYETGTTTDDSSNVYAYGVAATGSKAKDVSFEATSTFSATWITTEFGSAGATDAVDGTAMSSDYNGGFITSQYEVSSLSSGDKDANAAGWSVVFDNADSTNGVDINGSTDNAIFTAVTAFTVVGVAGLFF